MTREEAIEKIKRWKLEIDDEKDYADYLEGWFYKDDEIAFDMAIEALKEQKTGEWILSFNGYENTWICSECGEEYVLYDGTIAEQHYCPNCGAKMEVQND